MSRIVFTPQGAQRRGGGSAAVIVTADIVDRNGKRLGDLHETCGAAIEAWEAEFRALGLPLK
jgi:hypothetical protein